MPLSGKALRELMQAVHAKGRLFRFSAGGHSMAPFIKDGDVLLVAPPSASLPGPGDVLAFLHPATHRFCIHRVLTVDGDGLLLQGDNLPQRPDGILPREAVLGKVTKVERHGQRVRLGLGPERRLIAFLSRHGLLPTFRRHVGPLYRCFKRRPRPCAKG